jgi:hypothetical protein
MGGGSGVTTVCCGVDGVDMHGRSEGSKWSIELEVWREAVCAARAKGASACEAP